MIDWLKRLWQKIIGGGGGPFEPHAKPPKPPEDKEGSGGGVKEPL